MSAHAKHAPGSHQADGAAVGKIVLTGIALAILVIITMVGVGIQLEFYRVHFTNRDAANAQPNASDIPARVNSWAHPGVELAVKHEEEKKELTEYAWVDRQHGVVRIPIDRAMELVASQGSASSEKGAR